MYKPLPESLTIKPSRIHDLGLFADQDIKEGTNLGISHIKLDDKIIRTPLGGFINHANNPNCTKVELHANGQEPFRKKWNLVVTQDIKKGEELTLRYTFYNV
jgi:SET domain-containing protein